VHAEKRRRRSIASTTLSAILAAPLNRPSARGRCPSIIQYESSGGIPLIILSVRNLAVPYILSERFFTFLLSLSLSLCVCVCVCVGLSRRGRSRRYNLSLRPRTKASITTSRVIWSIALQDSCVNFNIPCLDLTKQLPCSCKLLFFVSKTRPALSSPKVSCLRHGMHYALRHSA
jgi:hypothetical protein